MDRRQHRVCAVNAQSQSPCFPLCSPLTQSSAGGTFCGAAQCCCGLWMGKAVSHVLNVWACTPQIKPELGILTCLTIFQTRHSNTRCSLKKPQIAQSSTRNFISSPPYCILVSPGTKNTVWVQSCSTTITAAAKVTLVIYKLDMLDQ